MGKLQKKETLSVKEQLVYLGTQYPDFNKTFLNFTTLQVTQVNLILFHAPKKSTNLPKSISANTHKCEEREKTNKIQQLDVYYQLLSQHVSGIIMPIFRSTKNVCHCIWCTALVLLDVVVSGCGALRCRMRAL